MAATSYDSIIAALGAGYGQQIPWLKQTITTTSSRWYSHWKSSGSPLAGATPATTPGTVYNSSSTGAMPVTDPSGANKLYGLTFAAGGTIAGVAMIYDRLVAMSGLDGTNTGAQTVNTSALTRYTSGVGVRAALEVYTAIGATPVTATISYTNQAGVAGRTSGAIAIPANAVAQTIIFPFPLQAGDTGVQSVQTVTLSGSTGTAGNFGITLYYDFNVKISWIANQFNEKDLVLQTCNLPNVQAGACLALASLATGANSGDIIGGFNMVQV